MYCVLSNKEIIAFHKKRYVCDVYIKNLKDTYKDDDGEFILYIKKIKDKKARLHQDFDKLYLVRYGDTYIQSEYIDYVSIQTEQIMHDNKYAMDVLIRLIDTEFPLSKKEKKYVENTIAILYNIIKEDEKYTPSLKDLKALEDFYEPYLNNYK